MPWNHQLRFFCFVSDPKNTIHTDIHHATNSRDPKEVPKFLLVGSGVQSSVCSKVSFSLLAIVVCKSSEVRYLNVVFMFSSREMEILMWSSREMSSLCWWLKDLFWGLSVGPPPSTQRNHLEKIVCVNRGIRHQPQHNTKFDEQIPKQKYQHMFNIPNNI